jgi:hypothetical protein
MIVQLVSCGSWQTGDLYPWVGRDQHDASCRARGDVLQSSRTAEQYIKEGKNAVTRTGLPCHSFKANAVRLQLHALAYNLGNFLRTLALPETVKQWSVTTLRERLVKIGTKIVRHGRSISFQMAEVMVPRSLFQKILAALAAL